MKKINSKTVVISGANSGIGYSCMEYFLVKGWKVIGVDLHNDLNDENISIFDVSCSKQVDNFAKKLLEKGIHLTCLINNAAIQVEKRLIDTTEDEWDKVINTNLKSVFLMSKNLVPLMNDQASIINISSVHAKATSCSLASYVASKGGVSSLSRAMALELAEKNIRVNSILPGAIATPMLERGLSRNMDLNNAREKLISATPLKKIGQPNDIASLAYFLADCDQASSITGSEFNCDGGVLARLASE